MEACFLKTRLNSECGNDRGKKGSVCLADCNDDISGHLAICHLSRESLSESQPILAQSRLSDVDQLLHMKI